MNIPEDFSKMAEWLRCLDVGARVSIRPPDECIPRVTYAVALTCPGVTFGEVRGDGDTLENAFFAAVVRREDALSQKEAA